MYERPRPDQPAAVPAAASASEPRTCSAHGWFRRARALAAGATGSRAPAHLQSRREVPPARIIVTEAVMRRREFVLTACALVPGALVGCVAGAEAPPATGEMQAKSFEIMKTEEEWRKVLTPAQFRILRGHGTERAGSSPLNGEHREGIYHCAGCDLPLFASSAKFESGTGWPSFTAPLNNAIGTSVDRSLFEVRTEVH